MDSKKCHLVIHYYFKWRTNNMLIIVYDVLVSLLYWWTSCSYASIKFYAYFNIFLQKYSTDTDHRFDVRLAVVEGCNPWVVGYKVRLTYAHIHLIIESWNEIILYLFCSRSSSCVSSVYRKWNEMCVTFHANVEDNALTLDKAKKKFIWQSRFMYVEHCAHT